MFSTPSSKSAIVTPGKDCIGVEVSVYLISSSRLLLVKKRDSGITASALWSQPCCTVHFGEQCEDACRRLIQEAASLRICNLELMDVASHTGGEQHWISISYTASIENGSCPTELVRSESQLHGEIDWFTLDDMPASLRPGCATAAETALMKVRSPTN